MLLALSTKNKVGFVNGTYLKNNDDAVLATQWDRCTTSFVWSELKETYDKVDGSIVFNLHHKISYSKQNGSSLSEYYHKLNTLWKQYDEMVKLPSCTCATSPEFQQHNKVLKLMQYLMGLDDVYVSTSSNLLLRDPLSNVKSAFDILSKEKLHRGFLGCATSDSLSSSTTSFSNSGSANSVNCVPMALSNEQMMKLLSMLNDKVHQTLESSSNMSENKMFVDFDAFKCYIQDLKTITILRTGSVDGGFYVFDCYKGESFMCNYVLDCNYEYVILWHNRLGHRSSPISLVNFFLKAKHIRDPFPLSDHVTNELGEQLHMDLWGPYRVASIEGYRYFLTIVDDHTRAVGFTC
ncbi:uncharacterized protein [Rutidosis leptorrhynchoides]|uniref:uncharacterized protein n=1 Tax=Rutidosis leptorrhynchoides TaxID=125765 RepID=UPI003A997194